VQPNLGIVRRSMACFVVVVIVVVVIIGIIVIVVVIIVIIFGCVSLWSSSRIAT